MRILLFVFVAHLLLILSSDVAAHESSQLSYFVHYLMHNWPVILFFAVAIVIAKAFRRNK